MVFYGETNIYLGSSKAKTHQTGMNAQKYPKRTLHTCNRISN